MSGTFGRLIAEALVYISDNMDSDYPLVVVELESVLVESDGLNSEPGRQFQLLTESICGAGAPLAGPVLICLVLRFQCSLDFDILRAVFLHFLRCNGAASSLTAWALRSLPRVRPQGWSFCVL